MKNGLRKAVTLEYPEIKKDYENVRGKIDVAFEKCTGCGVCVRVCPCKNLIKVETEKNEDGKTVVKSYEIDFSHCIFCGNCVENCPFGVLSMTKNYELATGDKNSLKLKLPQNGFPEDQSKSRLTSKRVD